MNIEELTGWSVELDIQVDGFEIDLVGYPCKYQVEWDAAQICPFNPGCDAKTYAECPLMKRRAMIALGTHARH
jgi:hypothetical protein